MLIQRAVQNMDQATTAMADVGKGLERKGLGPWRENF